jgi:hypothetical protein
MRQIFKVLDVDGDGVLSERDMQRGVDKVRARPATACEP